MDTSKWSERSIIYVLVAWSGTFFAGTIVAAFAVSLRSGAGRGWAAVLWAMAFAAIGFAVGFLFAVPRVSPNQSSDPPHLQVNTNLEQISDWLTKAITGVALANLKDLPQYVANGSYFLAQSLANCPSSSCQQDFTSLGGAIFCAFLTWGFLGGYIATRTFFTRLFSESDSGLQARVEGIPQSDKTALAQAPVSFEQPSPTLNPAAAKAADALQAVPVGDASAEALTLLGKAKLMTGKWDEAAQAYQKAVEVKPDDPATMLEYAYALRRTGHSPFEVQATLEKSEGLLNAATDKTLKRQVYGALTFQSLYLPAPDGFEKAITFGRKYVDDPTNPESGAVWVNLACAYGQKVRWLKNTHPDQETSDLRKLALDAAKDSIRIDPRYKATLKALTEPSETEAARGENDLEVFRDDPEFKSVVE